MDSTAPEFSFPLEIAAVPSSGRTYKIAASAEDCARVARRMGVRSVNALSAEFEVTPGARGIVQVTGRATAAVQQTCVVTLRPVPAKLSEDIAVSFIGPKPPGRPTPPAEEVLELDDQDPPEIAPEGRIDLGEVAVSQLILALDPYPRAPGAAFEAPRVGQEDEQSPGDSPFAALAKLKARPKP